jgi:transcriptional regulator with XRE-family HTH domain
MNSKNTADIMAKAREAIAVSGLTYQQIGERMGHPPNSARQVVYQFLQSKRPTLAMLERFAKAVGVDTKALL